MPVDDLNECGVGSSFSYGGGSIEQMLPLPSTTANGEALGLTLHYDSGLARSLNLGTPPSNETANTTNTTTAVPRGSMAASISGPKVEFFCMPRGVDPPASSSPGQCSSAGSVGSCGPGGGGGGSISGSIALVGMQNASLVALDKQIREMELGGWFNAPVEPPSSGASGGGTVNSLGYLTQSVSFAGGSPGGCAGGSAFGISDPRGTHTQLASGYDAPWVTFQHKTLVYHRFGSPFGSGWGIAQTARVFRTGGIAAIAGGDGQEENFYPRATATSFNTPFGTVDEHVYGRDLATGEIFVAYGGTIARMDPRTAAITPFLTGLSLNEYLDSMAITRVGSARHFLIATHSRLLDVDDSGATRQLATRNVPFPGDHGFYGQAHVAASGPLVFYTDGRESSKTVKVLRLTDATPTLVDASAVDGEVGLYPTKPLSGFRFENPHGLAFGLDGVLYVADPRRHAVYRVLPNPATGEVGSQSVVELGVGRGGGSVAAAVGERYPATTFSINQPVGLTVGEDGVVLVLNDYGITAYDPVAKEAETLLLDDSRDELPFALTDYGSNPHSFVAINKWSLFTRRFNGGPLRIDIEPLSSERDAARTLRPIANGGLELLDTNAGSVTRFDAMGRLVEARHRTGELMYAVTYADARTMKIDRITNQSGGSWLFAYSNEKISGITDPAGATTQLTINDQGDLVSMVLPDGERHAFDYDRHKMLSKTSPAGDVNRYTYAADGTAATAVKATGETHTFQAVLSSPPSFAADGTVTHAGGFIDAHGVAHTVLTNKFGDVEKETYTADGVAYEKKLVYASDLGSPITDPPPGTTPRLNKMLRVATSTLNGVQLSGQISYDRFGRPATQTATPNSGSSSFILRGWRYDDSGWLNLSFEGVSSQFPERFERDPAGHITRAFQDFGGGSVREARFTWRADGQPATTTVHGVTTTFVYDDAPGHSGNLLSTSNTIGQTSAFGYDVRGNVTSVTDGTASSSSTFDSANRLLETRDGLGNATTLRYTRTDCGCSERDLVSGIHTPDLPADVEWTFDYAPGGRVASVTDPQGFKESFSYNPSTGELASVTDRKTRTSSFNYDQLGRLASLVDTDGRKRASTFTQPTSGVWSGPSLTALSPDGTAASTSLTTPLRDGESQIGANAFSDGGFPARISLYRDATFALAYRYDHDAAGRKTRRLDRIGLPIDSVDFNNNTAALTSENWGYDIRNSSPVPTVLNATRPGGAGQRYQIDHNAEFDVTRDNGYGSGIASVSTATYTLDVAGRPLIQTNELVGLTDSDHPATYGAHFTYRPDGRVATISNVDGATVTVPFFLGQPRGNNVTEGPHGFTYDARGLVATQTDFDGTYTYSYDEVGRNTSLTYPDGHVRVQAFDDLGRITSRCYHYENGAPDRCYGASYDPVGNPVRLTDPEGADVVEYDALDRVAKVTREQGGTTTEEIYEYNALGALSVNASVAMDHQRLRLDGSGVAASAVPNTLGGQPVALDKGGRITALRGNSITWDSHNTIIGINEFGIGVNSAMNRVSKLEASGAGELYLYAGPNRIAQMEKSGIFTLGVIKQTWLFDGIDHPLRLSVAETTNITANGVTTYTTKPKATAYYELDLAGNVRRLRSPGGGDLGGYRYSAFGKTLENTAIDQPLRWKARPHDVFNGLEVYDMRARQWVPELGVFLSIDEYQFHDLRGTLWSWPHQSPIRYRDPSGHLPMDGSFTDRATGVPAAPDQAAYRNGLLAGGVLGVGIDLGGILAIEGALAAGAALAESSLARWLASGGLGSAVNKAASCSSSGSSSPNIEPEVDAAEMKANDLLKELNRLDGNATSRELSQFFRNNSAGGDLNTAGISRDALLVYRQVAQESIEAGRSTGANEAFQRERLDLIDRALAALGQ